MKTKLSTVIMSLNLESPANIETFLSENRNRQDVLNEVGLALAYKAKMHAEQGSWLEAVDLTEKALHLGMGDLSVTTLCDNLLGQAQTFLTETARADICNPVIGPLFRKLEMFGDISILNYFLVSLHYYKVGYLPEAEELLVRLARVAPNFPGVSELMNEMGVIISDSKKEDKDEIRYN